MKIVASKESSLWMYRCITRWYLQVVDELNKLNTIVSSYDKASFLWHKNVELYGILVVHVDDFLWSRSKEFVSHVIEPLKKIFKISSDHDFAFQYIGLNVKQEKTKSNY